MSTLPACMCRRDVFVDLLLLSIVCVLHVVCSVRHVCVVRLCHFPVAAPCYTSFHEYDVRIYGWLTPLIVSVEGTVPALRNSATRFSSRAGLQAVKLKSRRRPHRQKQASFRCLSMVRLSTLRTRASLLRPRKHHSPTTLQSLKSSPKSKLLCSSKPHTATGA